MTTRCVFIVACLSCLGCRASTPPDHGGPALSVNTPATASAASGPATQDTVVVAYYFHRTFRCYSCSALEVAILDVMNEHFARQIQDGQVIWTPVNIEDPTTQALQQQLEVRSNGLVLARMENGVHRDSRRMDELWGLKDRPEVFSQLLGDEIKARLTPVQSR